MELMKHADRYGYTKIALGHHLDDIIETFFMNMSYKAELSTMLPVLHYDDYPHTVIRPLSLVKAREITAFANEIGIGSPTCACPYDRTSKRRKMRKAIADYGAYPIG